MAPIRRRRVCPDCGGRFTTFERVQLRELIVVKRSGRKVPFDRDKLQRSVETALRKRPVEAERIEVLRDEPERENGRYVLLLLQQSNRARFNPALEVAIHEANRLELPVVACFGLLDGANGFPEANARHYAFLLQGLQQCA